MPLFLTAAVVNDYKCYKIGNHIIAKGFIFGIMIVIFEILDIGVSVGLKTSQMSSYMISSSMGLFLPFFVLLPAWLLGGIGAGDIKMLCVIGMLLRYREIIRFMIMLIPVLIMLILINIIIRKIKIGSREGKECLEKNSEIVKYGLKLHKAHLSYAIAADWFLYCVSGCLF